MVAEDNKIEKLCCFYVSEFHLEMILLPYINEKIEENIIIKTDRKLRDTVEILISKMNLNKERKDKILSFDWNGEKDKKIENESNVVIIGDRKYIEEENNKIIKNNIKDVTVIDCYNFEDTKKDIDNIINSYSKNLNTNGFNNII